MYTYIYILKDALLDGFDNRISVFVSSDKGASLPMGEDYIRNIEKALQECKVALILISNKSVNRNWINLESGVLWMRKLSDPTFPIIPVVCLAAAAAAYVLVIKPNQLLQQAENLIARGKYSEADVVLTEVPDSEKKTTLVTQIVLYEAEQALDAGDYLLAEKKISMLPSDAIDAELLYEINAQQAAALLGQGRYIEADALYAELEQTEDIILLREKLFYESRVLNCSAILQDTLLYPETLVLEEVLLSASDCLDEEQSNDTQKVYIPEEPTVLLHYCAQTRGGNMSDGFVRFLWEDNAYVEQISVDTLETDDDEPWDYEYMDAEERMEYHEEQMEIATINLSLYLDNWFETYDMERLNAVIKAGYAEKVQLIPNNEVVPLPTPRIVDVTPKPTSTPKP